MKGILGHIRYWKAPLQHTKTSRYEYEAGQGRNPKEQRVMTPYWLKSIIAQNRNAPYLDIVIIVVHTRCRTHLVCRTHSRKYEEARKELGYQIGQ